MQREHLLLLLLWWRRNRKKRLARVRLLALMASWTVEHPLVPDVRFALREMRDADAVLSFRFDVRSVLRLTDVLGLPHVVKTKDGDKVYGEEALCIVLKRMKYPIAYYDMMQTFGRSRGQLARIYHHTIDFLHARWKSTIFFAGYVDRDRLQLFADAVHRRGAPTINVFGFPDGTKVETCRPHASTAPEMNL